MLEDESYKMETNENISDKLDEKLIEKWRQLFNEDLLAGGHLKDYWRIWVPKAFVPPGKNEKAYEWEVKEDIVQNVLIGVLEEFICDADPKDLLKSLSQGASTSVCGKVFKMGEPSYNCRDCSTDVTCVLCVSCFKESTHRHHKYKMGTSMGGGCCDCGDTEAWKTDPYCDSHLAGLKADSGESKGFSKEMTKRCQLVFTAVLQYCTEILTLDHYPGLPRNLRLREDERSDIDIDLYCTLVYDHESYTFQDVVSTIATVNNCSNKHSLGYVTCIDREGRTILKCSDFHRCNELKQNIEKFTSRHNRPLVATVVHSHVVAHQMFALRLLEWLLSLCDLSKNFKQIFTCTALNLSLDESNCSDRSNEGQVEYCSQPSLVDGILLQDSVLWKSARLHWHRLFISGMFMEYDNKKAFAKVFTDNYCSILKNFIRDDHDYSFSFASLSIQIFTVPTLAVYLITHEDVLFKLLNTFVAECSKKRNEAGKLAFSRATSLGPFRRAMYILNDLRYLLHSPPEIWDPELRRGFIKGVTMMLNLLTYMQGMNSVKRQTGQHMEFEPEWETAFSLQSKLSPVITLVLKWCSTDQIVFMDVFRLALKKLSENCCDEEQCEEISRILAGHEVDCYKYDVSTQPVSIHLPLSRFLAGLYLHLQTFGLSYHCDEFISIKKPIPKLLIEPVLRALVMVAQVQAGLWRKNGYSLSNQIYYYHNVKCRNEMQDKDVVLLQIGASLIESNQFLIHLLNKFNLLDWADPEFETSFYNSSTTAYVKTSPKVVEEFLSLLVTIVSERYVPGVGNVSFDDCLKNEIIHQLFIKPLSHSELNKRLPYDVNHHETGMETVIDEVATFKKPSESSGKGIYAVKSEFTNKYNVFFYHYSKEDMSKSEEEQRKDRKDNSGLECCPPPDLPSFTPAFEATANLLQCDVMFHIMKIVLERTLDIRTKCYTEGQLHATLHLIGYALQEEEKSNIPSGFTQKAKAWDIEGLLENLLNSHRAEAHKDLIKWILEKYKTASSPESISKNIALESDQSTSNMEVDEQDNFRKVRSKLAAEKKAAILAQMAALQQNFLKENAALFQSNSCGNETKDLTVLMSDPSTCSETEFTVALGNDQSSDVFTITRTLTCILCQEDQMVELEGPALILSAFVQRSTVLSQRRTEVHHSDHVLCSNIGPAVHVSTCGHIMHGACWKNYINTIISKQTRRPYRILKQPLGFDIEKNEYLCPLCQRLSNTVLPVMPHLSVFCNMQNNEPESLPFSDWYEVSLIIMEENGNTQESDKLEECKLDVPLQNKKILTSNKLIKIENLFVLDGIGRTNIPASALREIFNYDRQHKEHEDPGCFKRILDVVNRFIDDTSKHDNGEIPVMAEEKYWTTWRTCAYTIHSSEWLLRYNNKSLLGDFTSREEECLGNLIRLSGAISFTNGKTGSMRSTCQWLLTRLFKNKDSSVLEWDSLGILIPLTVCMPSTFYKDVSPVPLGRTVERHCLRTALFVNIAQAIIYSDLSDSVFLSGDDVISDDTECLSEIVRILKDCQAINTIEIWEHLKRSSIQFLRCSAIFYHFLTGVPTPKSFKEVGGDTYENLMSFLGMPSNCKNLLGDPCVLSIFRKWAMHPSCVQLRHQVTIRNMAPMNGLTRLPDDYSELINSATSFTCPKRDTEEVRNPTLCLVCGAMLCSETYCCQNELDTTLVGSCTAHAHTCGSGTGLFLRIQDCKVLLLSGMDRGCFVAAPYLDNYGELDQGLKRGNPMRLCPLRYRDLELLWLSHGVQEQIARSIEQNVTIINTQWHHL